MSKKQNVIILAIHYDNLTKLKPILDKMKNITLKINTNIGEIWQPYNGSLEKVYGIIDDLIILNLTPEQRKNPTKLTKKILLKRCKEVQNFLTTINTKTDEDLAYATINHIAFCRTCQNFVGRKLNIGGNQDLELYIQKQLKEGKQI